MAVTMKNVVFWDVMTCSSLRTDVSEERIASIIRVTRIGALEQPKCLSLQEACSQTCRKMTFFIEYTFQFLIEAVFHIINVALCRVMNIQNNDIKPATSQCYV
jgi:hypothetical protein